MFWILNFLRQVPLKLYGYATIIFFTIVLLLRAYRSIYKAGENNIRVEELEKTIAATVRKNEIETGVSKLDSNDVDRILRENGWTRRE